MTTKEHVEAARAHLLAAVATHPKGSELDNVTRLLMSIHRLLGRWL